MHNAAVLLFLLVFECFSAAAVLTIIATAQLSRSFSGTSRRPCAFVILVPSHGDGVGGYPRVFLLIRSGRCRRSVTALHLPVLVAMAFSALGCRPAAVLPRHQRGAYESRDRDVFVATLSWRLPRTTFIVFVRERR